MKKPNNNNNNKLKDLIERTKQYNDNNNEKNGNNKTFYAKLTNTMNTAILVDSVKKLNPKYLAKNNPVMFTVELGFFLVLFISILSPMLLSLTRLNLRGLPLPSGSLYSSLRPDPIARLSEVKYSRRNL